MLQTAETKWEYGINRLHDSGQLPVIPPPHLWVVTMMDYADKGTVAVPAPGVTDKPKAYVWVNAGVWRTKCPLCGQGQHASRDEWFYCFYCRNQQAGGRVIPQVWPANADEIEKKLMFRPLPEFRHWAPGETIEQLARQDLKAIRRGQHLIGRR